MKWLIASDIHGSAHFCSRLLECFEREGAQRLLLLGDLLYHGARNDLPRGYDTRETARLLNSCSDKICAVRGNCDSEVDQMVLDFPMMADYAVLDTGKTLILATHGHIYNAQNPPPLSEGDILVYGHTHVPMCRTQNGVSYINPGSVSIPKEASPHSYIVYENGVFRWNDIEGGTYMTWPEK